MSLSNKSAMVHACTNFRACVAKTSWWALPTINHIHSHSQRRFLSGYVLNQYWMTSIEGGLW